MNKKLIGGIIGAVVVVAILGLGAFFLHDRNSDSENNNDNNSNGGNTQVENNTTSKADGKILVAYYSASGNTETVAKKIAANLGADTFEIVPQEVYTSEDLDWTADGSRVNREHENESLRDIALVETTPANWASYDTVLIGYPIWWAIAAWPVNNFVKDNDFSGKTVIPFATSTSSGLGQSGELLEKMANGGNWQTGRRFSSRPSDNDIKGFTDSIK